MRGIILAAGRGSRLAPLTDTQPKCFTVLNGRRLIDCQIAALRSCGVEEVAIVTGYRAELLDGLADRHFHNPRWANTQMVETLRMANSWLMKYDCIVSYSDIYFENYAAVALRDSEGDLVVANYPGWRSLWEARFNDPLEDAETFKQDTVGRLSEIGGRAISLDDIDGQFAGLLRFSPVGWSSFEGYLSELPALEVDRLDMTATLARLIARGVRINVCPIVGQWFEIDDKEDLMTAEKLMGESSEGLQ